MVLLGSQKPDRILSALAMVLLLPACSAGLSSLSSQVPYQASNAIMSAGYSETAVAPNHYRIVVTGYATTSKERMQKMATTRAAEIGAENRLGYFKIDSLTESKRCDSFVAGERHGRGERRNIQYAVLTAEVTYSKSPPDASYVDSKQAFDQYKAALDSDASPPIPVDPSAQCSS